MTRYILAAEADKIQDLVFRSAHLREVAGGSWMLTEFCKQQPQQLLRGKTADILVADGGSFTIVFDDHDESEAVQFGRALAQCYRQRFGSTMTVAAPEPWSGDPADFPTANNNSRLRLNQAKRQGRPATTVEHSPFTAFCASCGVALANRHQRAVEEVTTERPNYLCPVCAAKAREGHRLRKDFIPGVVGEYAEWFEMPKDADRAAEGWDPRQYVAYMLADGNGMGRLFGECQTPEQLKHLSEGLGHAVRASLSSVTQQIMQRAPDFRQFEVPTLPLILGGDDVFIRIPAPYALDFARRFCQVYEQNMQGLLRADEFAGSVFAQSFIPTVAVAVVVCKSKYPHALAHRYGETLLAVAKGHSKREAQTGEPHSVVNFDVILGSSLAAPSSGASDYQASLAPYWVGREDSQAGSGLDAARLIEQRLALASLPRRRLAQLEALFAPDLLPRDRSAAENKRWQGHLQQVIQRVGRSPKQVETLTAALHALGGDENGSWYSLRRRGQKEYRAHGLPDLLKMWEFSLDLEEARDSYESGEK